MRRYAARTAWFIRRLAAEVVPMNRIAELIEARSDFGMAMYRDENTPDDFTEREKRLAELIGYSTKEQGEIIGELHGALVANLAEQRALVASLREMYHRADNERDYQWRRAGSLERFIKEHLKLDVPKEDSDAATK